MRKWVSQPFDEWMNYFTKSRHGLACKKPSMEVIGYTAAIRMPVLQCHHVVSTGVATAHTTRFLPYSPTILNPSKICEKQNKTKTLFSKKKICAMLMQTGLSSTNPELRYYP